MQVRYSKPGEGSPNNLNPLGKRKLTSNLNPLGKERKPKRKKNMIICLNIIRIGISLVDNLPNRNRKTFRFGKVWQFYSYI